MKYYNFLSTICFGIFIIIFSLIFNGVSFGLLGKVAIILMFLFPLLGTFFGIKGNKGFVKLLVITLNIIALITIGYIALLSGMGEA